MLNGARVYLTCATGRPLCVPGCDGGALIMLITALSSFNHIDTSSGVSAPSRWRKALSPDGALSELCPSSHMANGGLRTGGQVNGL